MRDKKEQFLKEIESADSIFIAGHVRPDGDCIGSCMSLYQYIREVYKDKKVKVYFEYVPEHFLFLDKIEERELVCNDKNTYDLFVAVDSGDKDRLGDALECFEQAKKTICVDHHISNNEYAELNIVDPKASSAAEVMYQMLDSNKVTKEIATSIYLGMVHDSGVFKYQNTSKKTMMIAGELMEKGIDAGKIIDETFYQKTYIQNQILGRVLLESMLVLDGKGIVSCVSQKMMDFYGATKADLEGIVEQLRLTKGVEVAILLMETAALTYKVSMRSVEFINVSEIATKFGGGGHVRAAGCTMTGTFHDIINVLLEHCEKQMSDL